MKEFKYANKSDMAEIFFASYLDNGGAPIVSPMSWKHHSRSRMIFHTDLFSNHKMSIFMQIMLLSIQEANTEVFNHYFG